MANTSTNPAADILKLKNILLTLQNGDVTQNTTDLRSEIKTTTNRIMANLRREGDERAKEMSYAIGEVLGGIQMVEVARKNLKKATTNGKSEDELIILRNNLSRKMEVTREAMSKIDSLTAGGKRRTHRKRKHRKRALRKHTRRH